MLLILAPVIAEVVSGSTRLSFLFVLAPEILVWGIGALFCRELAKRWYAGWPSLVLLGGALAVAEEFLIQQTSIAPLPFPGVNAAFGRWGGVNWVYFLFMLVFESLWVVVIPVRLTEMVFPRFADAPWLRVRGAIVCAVGFLIGCRVAWFGWTQVARPRLGATAYHPPMGLLAAGVAAIVLLIGLAWVLRGVGQHKAERRIVPAWFAGVWAAVAGAAGFYLLGMIFQTRPALSDVQTLLCEIGLAVVSLVFFVWWVGAEKWTAMYAWAACLGAVIGEAAITSVSVAGYSAADFVFKCVVDVLAVVGMVWVRQGIKEYHPSEHKPLVGDPGREYMGE